MKIVVIGAGCGGLSAAYELAKTGHDVEVLEKDSFDGLSYDWYDDVQPSVFEELNLPAFDEKDVFIRSVAEAFVAPNSEKWVRVPQHPERANWSVERRPLAQMLANRAIDAGAVFSFSTSVDRLIIENDAVKGVFARGKEFCADLVIDSSGAMSKFRASLPDSFNITKQPKPDEVFHVYRGFHEINGDVPEPEIPSKFYLKHLGRAGISWCVVGRDPVLNVLIGKTGPFSGGEFEAALQHIKQKNPRLGDKVVRGGGRYIIPVRYPLSNMAANGYAAIGDAAFMTIPMIGSGIASSLRAGVMLAKALNNSGTATTEGLWEYQYEFFTKIGAAHLPVDILKRFLLSADTDTVRFLFEKEIIDEAVMDAMCTGEQIKFTPARMLQIITRGFKKLPFLIKLATTINKGEKAEAFAKTIPQKYDQAAVAKWQKKIDSLFGN